MRGVTRGVGALEVVLVLALVALLSVHLVIGDDVEKRMPEVLPDMVTSPAYEAQDPNPNFADGKTLQAPVPGTIARGTLPLRVRGAALDGTTPWKDLEPQARALWAEVAAPWSGRDAADAAWQRDLDRGGELWRSLCITCHGPAATGLTEVTKRGVPPPPSLLDPQAREYADGHIYRHITHGIGNMPSHASQIEREDRWRVILYLRSLQTP